MRDVEDVDQCDYDLVADDDFVLGAVPGVANAYVGVGWRGTGYKFAPWVGSVLAGLALGHGTDYDIDRFDPARFLEGGSARWSRPSQRTLQQRLADGVVVGAEGYVFELERRGYIKAGPFVPGGDPRRARRAPAAAPRVPARRLGRDGRADLLRAPGQAARRSAAGTTSRS